jgi:hypothetical protein
VQVNLGQGNSTCRAPCPLHSCLTNSVRNRRLSATIHDSPKIGDDKAEIPPLTYVDRTLPVSAFLASIKPQHRDHEVVPERSNYATWFPALSKARAYVPAARCAERAREYAGSLEGDTPPPVAVGRHCEEPYTCSFYCHEGLAGDPGAARI